MTKRVRNIERSNVRGVTFRPKTHPNVDFALNVPEAGIDQTVDVTRGLLRGPN